jgi:hypothetical protein
MVVRSQIGPIPEARKARAENDRVARGGYSRYARAIEQGRERRGDLMTVAPTLLDRALVDERWFRDGPPTWPNAPSQLDAIANREKAVRRLRRLGSREALKVANRLSKCGERVRRGQGRCLSPACFECSRALQRWLVNNTLELLKSGDGNKRLNLVAVHLVPNSGTQTNLDLSPSVVTNHHRRIHHALARAVIDAPVIGAFDVSYNSFESDHLASCWQVHYHLLVLTEQPELVQRLGPSFFATDHIPQPISIQHHDGSTYGVSYICKPTFWRKLYFGDRHRQPRTFELKFRQHVELLLQLDRLSLRDRLFLKGVRIRDSLSGINLSVLGRRCEGFGESE